MALHINMASTDPFFIFRSSTRQLSHLGLFHIISVRALEIKIVLFEIILKKNYHILIYIKPLHKQNLTVFYSGRCIKPLAF